MSSLYPDQASVFASSNREVHADMLLTIAVREGAAAFKVGLGLERRYPGMGGTDGLAELVERSLLAAATRAEGILGPRPTSPLTDGEATS